MTTEKNEYATQFQDFINSNVPDEYKEVIQHFQNQGLFYQQLLEKINNEEPGLSDFWNLPQTLGFNTLSDGQLDWLHLYFSQNPDLENLNSSSLQAFLKTLSDLPGQLQENIRDIQSALQKINHLYATLSKSALEQFEALKNKCTDPSDEQLCQFWLTAGETAFSEISQTPDYIEAHQQLMKSAHQLKTAQFNFFDTFAHRLGLPSQQTMNDLQKGLHTLRIEFAEYKEQTEAKIDELQQTICRLK